MRTVSQLLLTFLLNSCWQVVLVAAFACLASWLLRNSAARYRYWIWVSALLISFGIPLATSVRVHADSLTRNWNPGIARLEATAIQPLVPLDPETTELNTPSPVQDGFLLSRSIVVLLMAIYGAIFFYSFIQLVLAWFAAKRLLQDATEIESDERISSIVDRSAVALSKSRDQVRMCVSDRVLVPITIGLLTPTIILPRQLLSEANDEVLMSAVGHEFVHVRRRDYAFNLFYEFLYLPLSFHPCATLIRRRIRQTRELSCDEVVAERIINPEAYARSLVKLASSAPPVKRLSLTTTVGIADADILEARIMSLLNKTKLDTRRKRVFLIALSILLLVPCVAIASFAMKFDLKPTESAVLAQEPSQQEKERREKEMLEMRGGAQEQTLRELRERMANDPQFREEIMRRRQQEIKFRTIRQNALVKLAKISMDQAIQIATSQKSGTVLECSLDAEHWQEPGKLAEDSSVFYRVVIVSPEDAESGALTQVWVNAVDGSVMRSEREMPRVERP